MPRRIERLACIAFVAAAALPFGALAQSGRGVTNWTCNCPARGPVEVPNSMNGPAPDCRSVCYPSGATGSGSAGLTPLQEQFATQMGSKLGSMMRDAIFGNPQDETNRRAQQAAALAAAADEEQRRKAAARDRMLSLFKEMPEVPAPRGVAPGAPARGAFKWDDADFYVSLGQVPANSVIAQVTRAAYLSDGAAHARTDEDAAALAEAAFSAALGSATDLPVPAAIPAERVSDAEASRLEAMRKDYAEASRRANEAAQKAADAQERLLLAERLAAEARRRAEDAERVLARAKAQADRRLAAAQASSARATAAEAEAFLESQRLASRATQEALSASSIMLTPPSSDLNAFIARYRRDDPYRRGILDASSCNPQNAGPVCGANDATCVQKYRTGYEVGQRGRETRLREAHAIGREAKEADNVMIGFNHPKSAGPCRVRWLESFYAGYGGAPFTMVGR